MGHAERMRDMKNAYRILVENTKRGEHFGDLNLEGRIKLKGILKK
jgi:hypothetical protein